MIYTHKNLTVMFTDICGFTKQTSTTSRNDLMERLSVHNALLTPVIQRWGGTIIKSIGDAFLLTFESPTDALHCALCLQHTLRAYNREAAEAAKIHIKISVNCGEVTVTDTDVFGDPVNVAAKIEKATQPNEIYFTEAVFLAMNKSEVPCEHVSTFAAPGDESSAIELYRVLMDETDPRYPGILSACEAKALKEITKSGLPAISKTPVLPPKYRQAAALCAVAFVTAASTFLLLKTPGTVNPMANTADVAPTSYSDDAKQAKTLAWAKSVVQDPEQLKEKSHAVIERLTTSFGEAAAENASVRSMLYIALMSSIYWEARNLSFEAAGDLLRRYRERFFWVSDWKTIERERYLGGFNNYSTNNQLRRSWLDMGDTRWYEHYHFLKSFADHDADFGFRFAVEINEINRRNHLVAGLHEQILMSKAIQLKPALLQTERDTLLPMLEWWLQFEQKDNNLARELVRKHFYDELRPWLVANLMVESGMMGSFGPDYSWRQNCLALLAEKDDLEAIGNPWVYIKNNPDVFMRASETVKWGDGTIRNHVFLTSEQIRRVLQRPMSEEDRAALLKWLDDMISGILSGNGRWANNEDSRLTAMAMKAQLLTR